VLPGGGGLLATLVRLESERGVQDAVVISRIPRRWGKLAPPWGGERAAVVIAGRPPRLRPLSPDFAVGDVERARRATERIPEEQWEALSRALRQLRDLEEGLYPVELGAEPWYGSLCELERDGSLPAGSQAGGSQAWCAGFPCIEEPEMVAVERARVERWRKRAIARMALHAVLTMALPLSFVALLLARGATEDHLGLAVLSALLTFVVTPFTLLATLTWWARVRSYREDLQRGRVQRFAGTLSSFDSLGLDPDLALLTRRGMLVAEPGVEQELVMLPASRELLYANKDWAPPGLGLHAEHVALPPDSPLKLPLPEDMEAQVADAVTVARRRLTREEVAELSRHARSLRTPGRVFWVLAGFAALALLTWHESGWSMPPQPLTIPLTLAAFGFALLLLWRRTGLSWRLQQDADLGWVLTVDHSAQAEHVDADLPAQGVETLLHGRLDWTVNRRPAAWRRFGARTT
jgi:hypothetical protein